MGTGPKKWTEELIARRVKEGRGLGDRESYSPWLYVQEFSSRGTQTRMPSLVLKRTIHTFSYLELALYLLWEFFLRQNLLDYKEQFPLDRRITLAAAEGLGIRHPRYEKTRVPVVMTLDAVVTWLNSAGQRRFAAWDVKPTAELKHRRTLEKLSLHRACCAHLGIPHLLFTEKSFPKTLVNNIVWLRWSRRKNGEIEAIPGLLETHGALMLEDLCNRHPDQSIRNYCTEYDKRHCLPSGGALRVLKVLLWQRELTVDLTVPKIELQRVPCLPASPSAARLLRVA